MAKPSKSKGAPAKPAAPTPTMCPRDPRCGAMSEEAGLLRCARCGHRQHVGA